MAAQKSKLLFYCGVALVVVGILAFRTLREPSHEGKTVTEWMQEYETNSHSSAREALLELGSEAIPFIKRGLENRQGAVEGLYSNAWRRLPAGAQESLPAPDSGDDISDRTLIKMAGVIGRRLAALERQGEPVGGPDIATLVPFLVEELEKPLPQSGYDSRPANKRRAVIYTLGYIGAKSRPAVPALTKIAISAENRDRTAALQALRSIGSDTDEPVIPLLQMLRDTQVNHRVRIFAASALAKFGPLSKPAVPLFTEWAQQKDDADFRRLGSQGLVTIGHYPFKTRAALKSLLKEADIADLPPEENWARIAVAVAVWRIEPDNALAARVVEDYLHRGSDAESAHPWRVSTIHNLGECGPDMRHALPLLRDLGATGDDRTSFYTDIAIRKIESSGDYRKYGAALQLQPR